MTQLRAHISRTAILRLTWAGWLFAILFTACHPAGTSSATMSATKNYIVSAKIINIRQQDISKVRGKQNLYTYLDLHLLNGAFKHDPDEEIPFDTCHVTRKALPGDETLKSGDFLQLEIGVGAIARPQYVTWVKRLD